jgi:hypothetical protein
MRKFPKTILPLPQDYVPIPDVQNVPREIHRYASLMVGGEDAQYRVVLKRRGINFIVLGMGVGKDAQLKTVKKRQ